jgi:hypothetical protein
MTDFGGGWIRSGNPRRKLLARLPHFCGSMYFTQRLWSVAEEAVPRQNAIRVQIAPVMKR